MRGLMIREVHESVNGTGVEIAPLPWQFGLHPQGRGHLTESGAQLEVLHAQVVAMPSAVVSFEQQDEVHRCHPDQRAGQLSLQARHARADVSAQGDAVQTDWLAGLLIADPGEGTPHIGDRLQDPVHVVGGDLGGEVPSSSPRTMQRHDRQRDIETQLFMHPLGSKKHEVNEGPTHLSTMHP